MEIRTLNDLVEYCEQENKCIGKIARTGDIVCIILEDNKEVGICKIK